MKLCILSACYDQPCRAAILTESCARIQLPLLMCQAKEWEGSWRVPGDYRTGKLQAAYETLLEVRKQYDYAMWVDGFDAFIQLKYHTVGPSLLSCGIRFIRSTSEIIEHAWELLQCPPLVLSAEKNCYPYPNWSESFLKVEGPYRFPCAGAWMGQAGYLIDTIRAMLDCAGGGERNDQALWQRAFMTRELPGAVIDSQRLIFQNMYDVPDFEATEAPVVHYNGEASWGKSTRYQEHWKRIRDRK